MGDKTLGEMLKEHTKRAHKNFIIINYTKPQDICMQFSDRDIRNIIAAAVHATAKVIKQAAVDYKLLDTDVKDIRDAAMVAIDEILFKKEV